MICGLIKWTWRVCFGSGTTVEELLGSTNIISLGGVNASKFRWFVARIKNFVCLVCLCFDKNSVHFDQLFLCVS